MFAHSLTAQYSTICFVCASNPTKYSLFAFQSRFLQFSNQVYGQIFSIKIVSLLFVLPLSSFRERVELTVFWAFADFAFACFAPCHTVLLFIDAQLISTTFSIKYNWFLAYSNSKTKYKIANNMRELRISRAPPKKNKYSRIR